MSSKNATGVDQNRADGDGRISQAQSDVQPKDTKSVPLVSTSKPDEGVLTLEKLEEYFDSAVKAAENPEPHHTLLPDMAVDLYLEQGVIPQFVMVSSTSKKKIEAYIKAHPETKRRLTT